MPEFSSPHFYFGDDAIDSLNIIRGKKCFIVTDKGVIQAGLLTLLTDKLKEYEREWKVFDEVEPDPNEKIVMKGLAACKDYAPNLIIGLGGGAAMDTAKSIYFLYENEELNIDDINPFTAVKIGLKSKCIAIPTTAGTGAETTWAVVISRTDANGKDLKMELVHRDCVPTFAIIDARFSKGLPAKLTAATGFDALAHSFEGLVSAWRNDVSDALCIHAIDLIRTYLPRAYKNGADMEARNKMGIAATIAGLGFGNSQVVLGHSIGHSLGAVFHIPHGVAVGVILPYAMEYCLYDPKGQTIQILGPIAKKLGLADVKTDDKQAAINSIKMIREIAKAVNFPGTLKECGITKEKLEAGIDRVVQLANESACVSMTPRDVTNEHVRKILQCAFEGKSVDF